MHPPAGTWAYLPFLLVWALPVLAVQWLVGARYLWRERGRWPWIVLGLGVYFTAADAIAIATGTWRFNARALVGPSLGPVPIEEVLFYLLTAAMVVQGFVVAWGVWGERAQYVAQWRARLSPIVRLVQRGQTQHPTLSSGSAPKNDTATNQTCHAQQQPPSAARSPDGY